MGLWDPEKCPFPVFSLISRVRNLRSGPKFHRLSVSWPYSCVKSLKKFGHSGPEIWAFETPKNALFLCFHWYLEFGILDLAQNFTDRPSPGHTAVWKVWRKFGHSGPEIWAFETPKNALFLCFHWYLEFGILDLAQNFTDCPSPGHTAVWKVWRNLDIRVLRYGPLRPRKMPFSCVFIDISSSES